jgi:pyruvate-ferredoxin/flavodoxin oxidoreductase
MIAKKAHFYVIDANKVARASGMGARINTIMQTCFFAVSGVLPREEAVEAIKKSIRKTYGKKGEEIVLMNIKAVDQTLANLHEVKVPLKVSSRIPMQKPVSDTAPEFVRNVLGEIIAGRGDALPVSALPVDGTYPTSTTQWEKRNLATEIPVWDPEVCIQCGKCVMVCPHAVIRSKVYDDEALEGAPSSFKSHSARLPEWKGMKYTIQVSAEDCTGCTLCVDICPARNKSEARLKAINMQPIEALRAPERDNWNFFQSIREADPRVIQTGTVREMQVRQPLFEFSGACTGCGETPYIKLLTQLFGDRLIIANATGCSSIYGGNLPTTPYAVNAEGRGPAWCNSLFEDNAEFGLGFRVSLDKQKEFAEELLAKMGGAVGDTLVSAILTASLQKDEADIFDQRVRVAELKQKLSNIDNDDARRLLALADTLVRKSVWILGGDGWGYDIGYGGLDHVLASGRNVKVLLMDTEVYSNTGGQCSKSTPRAAVAKFASGGKRSAKKDLGLISMTYGSIYVASVAMGAKDEHTLKAFVEAEAYDGPAIILAYSHCIAHGIEMHTGLQHQKAAVQAGQWLLYRYNPDKAAQGENPLHLDSSAPKLKLEEFLNSENRFKLLSKTKPQEVKRLHQLAQQDVDMRWSLYQHLASRVFQPMRGNETAATNLGAQ